LATSTIFKHKRQFSYIYVFSRRVIWTNKSIHFEDRQKLYLIIMFQNFCNKVLFHKISVIVFSNTNETRCCTVVFIFLKSSCNSIKPYCLRTIFFFVHNILSHTIEVYLNSEQMPFSVDYVQVGTPNMPDSDSAPKAWSSDYIFSLNVLYNIPSGRTHMIVQINGTLKLQSSVLLEDGNENQF
jgi:hypothetical protein